MTKKDRYKAVVEWFQQTNPNPETELQYKDPYQLLIAVILSAQSTDKRVNIITPPLFEAFPTPEVLAVSSPDEVYEYIKTINYPNSKAKYLVGMARKLIDNYGGNVPEKIDDLIRIPGVGRKTANVISSVVFGNPALAVDTHVFRVANRIGLTDNSKSPEQTERELTKHIPKKLWSKAHHWLILHGRYICLARKPKCEVCGLTPYCNHFSATNRNQESIKL